MCPFTELQTYFRKRFDTDIDELESWRAVQFQETCRPSDEMIESTLSCYLDVGDGEVVCVGFG